MSKSESVISLVEQKELVRLARAALTKQLKQFGLSVLPASDDLDGEAFYRDSVAQEVLRAYRRELGRQARMRHPEMYREASCRYYRAHTGQALKARADYRAAHLEERKEYDQAYARSHREVYNTALRRHYKAYKEVVLTRLKAYQQAHPDKVREISRAYRARKAGAEGSFTEAAFAQLCLEFGGRCAYCGRKVRLVPDHMVPLSRGGTDFIENIIPACGSCNSSKGDKMVEEFLARLESKEE